MGNAPVSTNDNLCPGDLFKAKVLPKIEPEIIWTLSNADVNYTSLILTCQWDKSWTVQTFETYVCEAYACANPPIPDENLHLKRLYEKDTLVGFGRNVTYECEDGYFFEENY